MPGQQLHPKQRKFQLLFHSLQLPGFTRETEDLAKQIVGSWQSVSSSAGGGLIFAANGHFDDVGAYGSYHVTNLGQVIYETHSTWPGSGSYQLAGDRLTMRHNGRDAETTLISILRRPKPGGRYDQILRIVEPAKFAQPGDSATRATTRSTTRERRVHRKRVNWNVRRRMRPIVCFAKLDIVDCILYPVIRK